MKSRLVLNLVLLVVVAILGALAILEPGKKKADTAPIARVDENTLTSITLKNKDTIVFEKKDGHWRITSPIQAPANEIRVRQLIGIAQSHSEADYPVTPADLGKFELTPPKATLILGTTTLVFGGSDPINLRRYVQSGETLHLVNDNFFHHLMASATDYVDKKLLPENAKVREMNLPGLKASLGQDGKWTKETTPPDAKADIPEMAALWATARAIDVKRLDKPAQGDPVKIGLAEGGPVDFVIVQREPDVVLARPDLGLQYELTGTTARQLLNLPKTDASPGSALQPPMDDELPPDEGEDEGLEPPEMGEDDGNGEEHEHPEEEEEPDEPPAPAAPNR